MWPLPSLSGSVHPSIAGLYAQLTFVKRQAFILEAENALLREESEKLRLMVKVLLAETATLQAMRGCALGEKATSHPVHTDTDTISRLEKQLTDYRNFVRALGEGQVLDSRIIYYAQAGIDDGHDSDIMLVEAIQAAASDNDSPWSKILPALINKDISGKQLAAANMALKLRKDLHEMEKLARFWKSQAILRSNAPTKKASSRLSESLGEFDCSEAPLKHCLRPATSTLGDTLEELQNNRACKFLTYTPSTPINLERITHNISGLNGNNSGSLRPSTSEGIEMSTIRAAQHKHVHTKRSRRVTFHGSLNLEAQESEKRHGFIMPRLKPVSQKHTSAPANIHSPFKSFALSPAGDSLEFPASTFPFKPDCSSTTAFPTSDFSTVVHRLFWTTSQALQSAERLCATFSSGSLGSLEMSTSSDSNYNIVTELSHSRLNVLEIMSKVDAGKLTSLSEPMGLKVFSEHKGADSRSQFDIERIKSPADQGVSQAVTSGHQVGKMSNIDTTITSLAPQRRCRNCAQHVSTELSTSATGQSVSDQSLTLPSVNYTVRTSHPSANQSSQRATRMYHSKINTHQQESKITCPRISVAPASTLALGPIRAKSPGCTSEKDTSEAISTSKVARSSARLVPVVCAPASTVCIPKPSLNFVKSGIAKTTASVSPAKNPTSTSSSQMPVSQRTRLLNSYPRTHLCSDRTVGTYFSASAIPKTRSRLRVINKCDSGQDKSIQSPPTHSQTQPRTNLWGHTGIQEGGRFGIGGRVTRDGPGSSNAGLMRGVGQAVQKPHMKGVAVKLESRKNNKRP